MTSDMDADDYISACVRYAMPSTAGPQSEWGPEVIKWSAIFLTPPFAYLFDWMVDKIVESVEPEPKCDCKSFRYLCIWQQCS